VRNASRNCSSAGFAPQLSDDVLLGLGHDHRPADRAGKPCDTNRAPHAAARGAGRPAAPERKHLAAPAASGFSPGPAPPLAMPPTAGTCGPVLVQPAQTGRRPESCTARRSPAASPPAASPPLSRSGQPMNVASLGRPETPKCMGTNSTPGSRAAHQHDRPVSPSTSTPVADDRFAGRSDHAFGFGARRRFLPANRSACGA